MKMVAGDSSDQRVSSPQSAAAFLECALRSIAVLQYRKYRNNPYFSEKPSINDTDTVTVTKERPCFRHSDGCLNTKARYKRRLPKKANCSVN